MKKLIGTILILFVVTNFFGQINIEQKLKLAEQYHKQYAKQSANQKANNTQAVTYTVGPITYAPFSYTAGTAANAGTDDVWSNIINIGFNFNYFGSNYNKLLAGANGQASFDLSSPFGFENWVITTPIPSTADMPGKTICAAYRDIDISFSGSINYATYGIAPNRYFVLSWYDIRLYNNPGACAGLSNSTFQLVLYETTNCIDIFIQNSTSCPGWNGGFGIIGIQDSSATVAYTPPSRNAPNAWTAVNEAWRFIPSGSSCGFPTKIKEINQNNTISIYPNPTNGIFTIKNNFFEGNSLEVFNLLGEKIIDQKINNSQTKIDLSDFSNGMYWVKLISKEKEIIYQTKIVKE